MASTGLLVELTAPSLAMKTQCVTHGLGVRRLAPPEATFLAELHSADRAEARHAVAVIGGSGGGLALASEQAAAFAESGIDALGIAYFKEPGLPETLAEIPLEYFAAALDWFHGAVKAERLVVMGISRGSEAALLLGVHFPQLVGAVAAMVPGNVVLCSWPPGKPAWTLGGEPLPYVGYFGPACADPQAVIPVERIRGPLLLLSAGADVVICDCHSGFEVERVAGRAHLRAPVGNEASIDN